MHPKEKINFIISGVRDGFKKSHLLCNNNIAEVIDYIDDRRQISNSANEIFYSIEKTANYTLATLFNPNTTDQVGRKAYVAITLFVRNGYAIQGNLIDTLNGLMNYYLLKQGNEISNRFTEEMFEAEYANLSIVQSSNTLTALRKNCGYFNYENSIEINAFFENLTITGFQKVYFLSPPNAGVINQLISFEKITQFPVTMAYQISDFKYGKYEILLNGEPYRVQGNNTTINIVGFQGDLVTIKNISTGGKATFTITAGNQSKSIFIYFPDDKPQPHNPHRISNSKPTNISGHGNYAPQKKHSAYLIAAVVVLSIVLLSIIGYIIWEKYYGPGAAGTVTDTTQVNTGGATNSPSTKSPTGEATNSPITKSPTGEATNNNTQVIKRDSSNNSNHPDRSSSGGQSASSTSDQTPKIQGNLLMKLEDYPEYLKNCNSCKNFNRNYNKTTREKKRNIYNEWFKHTGKKNEHK